MAGHDERLQRILELHDSGHSQRAIGEQLGLSSSRIGQLIAAARFQLLVDEQARGER